MSISCTETLRDDVAGDSRSNDSESHYLFMAQEYDFRKKKPIVLKVRAAPAEVEPASATSEEDLFEDGSEFFVDTLKFAFQGSDPSGVFGGVEGESLDALQEALASLFVVMISWCIV
ncbi:hypothetical protein AK812_SmicGene4427 [Symbiodinium microadriaticum]|uniref:Uncharacterized protein n=1 Tax=Symbiodinium microadriaticum TaxID=2951 RepID=A0A1Q9EW93_SYMMI|nr:hypothetical protein AK812_SmicGene4427 [Symbiodinium microadriaticum]